MIVSGSKAFTSITNAAKQNLTRSQIFRLNSLPNIQSTPCGTVRTDSDTMHEMINITTTITAPQHLVCRAVQSLHINHMQTGIIEVFICRRLHMNTSTILICIWLVCRLCTTLHTKCCGAVNSAYNRLTPIRNGLSQDV